MSDLTLEGALGFYDPKVTAPQGINSPTFTAPGINTHLTIPEVFELQAQQSAQHPVFVYADDKKQNRYLDYPDVYRDRAIRKGATFAAPHLDTLVGDHARAFTSKDADHPVVGILANCDTISGFTFLISLMYLAVTPFPISIRNSPVAIAHLAMKTGVCHMFVSSDPAMQRLAHQANEILAKDGHECVFLPYPLFKDLYGPGGDENLVPMGPVSKMKSSIIMHSSGSTAFPKPVRFKDIHFKQWGTFFYYGQVDMCGIHIGGQANPMFHGMGCLMIAWTLHTGMIWTMFEPTNPPVAPTPEAFLESWLATDSEMLFCVPAFVEAWATNPDSVEKLKTLRLIIYAGAPMNKQIGDRLTADGVALVPFYGSTEIGTLTHLIPDPDKMDKTQWDWFEMSKHIDSWLIPQKGQPGIFEPIAFASPTMSPNVFNVTYDGRPAYATSDLLQQHPEKPHLFRVYGRADDQLMLSTGEKTNPAPLEAILLRDPAVYACLMFGRGRFQNGILVHPTEEFDPSDEVRLESFRNKIWPSVEKMNVYAPAHSRIFKETILVSSPAKPLEYTAKGTPRRQVSLAAYEDEIDALYKRIEHSSQTDIPPPRDWSLEAVLIYVGDIVRGVMNNTKLTENGDLFVEGCDSLQATWIRNTILHALRSSSTANVHAIPTNFVYTHPTIASLAAYVSTTALSESGIRGPGSDDTGETLALMHTLVGKYGTGMRATFPTVDVTFHDLENNEGSGGSLSEANCHDIQTVLVTGTTGRLGSHLLAQLLMRQDVTHVYALNHVGHTSRSVADRSREAFSTWGLDEGLLEGDKLSLIEADLSKPHFGIGEDIYEEIRSSVTQIFHNGWRVDFNVSLRSFEPLIAGSRNLLDLALNSPLSGGPRVVFVSSAGVLRNHASTTPAVENSTPPELALGGGYPESKWIAEQLFLRASKETGLRAISVRVGQISGDQAVGGWGTREWVPTLVRTSQRLGCLPSRNEDISWIPVNVVATALQEMVFSDRPVLHLVSPRPVPWDAIFSIFSEKLGIPLTPYVEWLSRVEQSTTSARAEGNHDTAHSLLSFFRADGIGGASVPMSTARARHWSNALDSVQPLTPEDALKYLQFWNDVGFIRM